MMKSALRKGQNEIEKEFDSSVSELDSSVSELDEEVNYRDWVDLQYCNLLSFMQSTTST